MKKSFLKFGLLLALGLATVTFYSCVKYDDKDDNGNGKGDGFEIIATDIENSSSQIATVKAFLDWKEKLGNGAYRPHEDMIAQAKYQNNGFVLELPKTLADKYLEPYFYDEDEEEEIEDILEEFEDVMGDYYLSDIHVKTSDYFSIDAYDKNDIKIGYFWLEALDEDYDYYSEHGTTWMYFDRDFIFKGEGMIIFRDEEDGEIEEEEWVIIYDLDCKKGWNVVYASETYDFNYETDREMYIMTMTSQKPADVNFSWYFNSYSNYKSDKTEIKSIGKKNYFLKKPVRFINKGQR
jgi:hypothetical protein